MILQDRSGNDDPDLPHQESVRVPGRALQAAARSPPPFLRTFRRCRSSMPTWTARKPSPQQVDLNNIYTTMQTFMGGYLVNYFNRFGRQWQTYVEAEGDTRTNIQNINQFYVRSANGGRVPLGSLVHVRQITGPEFILRFNEYNAAQLNITGAPGLQFRPGACRAGRGLPPDACR